MLLLRLEQVVTNYLTIRHGRTSFCVMCASQHSVRPHPAASDDTSATGTPPPPDVNVVRDLGPISGRSRRYTARRTSRHAEGYLPKLLYYRCAARC